MSQAKVTNFFSTAKRGRRAVNKKNLSENLSPGLVETTNKTVNSPQQTKIIPQNESATKFSEAESNEVSQPRRDPPCKENKEQLSNRRTKRKVDQVVIGTEEITNPTKKCKGSTLDNITSETLTTAISQAKQLAKKQKPTKTIDPETISKTINEAKSLTTKLTPAQVKEKLTKTGKLADLKKCLSSINAASNKNKLTEKVKKETTKETPKEESSEATTSPTGPKESTTAKPSAPAYERFHALSQPATDSLPLPHSYKVLVDTFRCTDTVVAMMHNRQERITLSKVRKAVQEMMRKDFGDLKLQQISTVFPTAYLCTWEKILSRFGAAKNEYELLVAANTNYKNDIIGDEDLEKAKGYTKMAPNMLVERKRIFSNSLLEIVKKHHAEFLSNLSPPIQVESDRITKWHRDFDLDACTPVQPTPFPLKPVVEKLVTAREVLDKAEELFNLNPKLSEALVTISEKVKEDSKEEPKCASPPKPEPVLPKGLKGLNSKLIEKIRAKEAAKAKMQMVVNPEETKKLERYKRLPGLARIIRNIFISEKKAALDIKFVAKKAAEAHFGFLNQKNVEEDIKELVKVASPWPTLHLIRDINYLKIRNDIDINVVVEKLEGLKAKLEAEKSS